MELTSYMKRLVILPTVFGYIFSIVIQKVVQASPDLKVFPMIEYFGEMYGLSSFVSTSLLALVYFYFLGYGYGLLSTVLGTVLPSTKKGIFKRLFFILLKVAILLPNSLFIPIIFLGDVILMIVKKAAYKKRRPNTTPYQHEEKAL